MCLWWVSLGMPDINFSREHVAILGGDWFFAAAEVCKIRASFSHASKIRRKISLHKTSSCIGFFV
jgi:hypothetical protein